MSESISLSLILHRIIPAIVRFEKQAALFLFFVLWWVDKRNNSDYN